MYWILSLFLIACHSSNRSNPLDPQPEWSDFRHESVIGSSLDDVFGIEIGSAEEESFRFRLDGNKRIQKFAP